MGRIRDMLAGLGFIITAALVTTNIMPDQLIGIRTQSTQIFFTNCRLICIGPSIIVKAEQSLDDLQLKERCSMIFILLQASLISVGCLLLLFGATKWVSIFSIINLIGLSFLYANPLIDHSFQTNSLFLMFFMAIAAFLVRIFRQSSEGEEGKIHKN